MTRLRNDTHSTEFGLWLRQQKEIDSGFGYIATNVDYIWENYKTGNFILLEEKRYKSDLTFSQKNQLKRLSCELWESSKFKGFHLLQFENTNPDDGKIYLDRNEISKDQLIKFLQFKLESRFIF